MQIWYKNKRQKPKEQEKKQNYDTKNQKLPQLKREANAKFPS